jgi:transposase
VTSVEVTQNQGPGLNDNAHLPALLDKTVKRGFAPEMVSADKAYLSRTNLAAIEAARAFPLIPVKSNSIGLHASGKGSDLWRKMFGFFTYRREEFLKHYHQRSNVETTFQHD